MKLCPPQRAAFLEATKSMPLSMSEPTQASSVRTTKRKLEDAIRTLDGSHQTALSPSLQTPSKRPRLAGSVYSMLVKLGASSKEKSLPPSATPALDISKSAPHLASILARSVSQRRRASSFYHLTSTPPAKPVSEYRPSSTDSFLSRLATYKITTYANKPPQIDAVAAARRGWLNDGKDRLVCGICDVSWVLASREGMNKDAARALVERQHVDLVEMHKDGCPWKTRQCEPSVYRIPLQAPAVMVRQLRAVAVSLEPILANVAVKHPLTASELSSLHSIFATESERRVSERDSDMDTDQTTYPVTPSDTAVIVALFGWVPAPIMTNSDPSHPSSLLFSRAGSYGPSASRPPTPSLSRTSSVSSHLRERASPSAPSISHQMSISQFAASPGRARLSSRIRNSWSDHSTALAVPRDASLVYCTLCHRRIGLWGYAKNDTLLASSQHGVVPSMPHERRKEFDLVKEHRSYCPYVVRSSVVPSFSRSPIIDSDGNATEGWRAVLTVVQRFELSQRQRLSRFLPRDHDNATSSAELKGVEDMVAGVKNNGGRELLKYVKGLLG